MPTKKIHIASIMPIQKKWLSAREAGLYLDCSDEFLQNLRNNGKLGFSQYGGKIWYELAELDKFFEKHKVV